MDSATLSGMLSPTGSKITRLSKVIAGVLALFSLLYCFVPALGSHLPMVPGKALFQPWSLVTAGFTSSNPFDLAVAVASILLLARAVEPVRVLLPAAIK